MSHDFRSHNLLNRAVSIGFIVRPERCESCSRVGKTGKLASIEAHHDNYNLPLAVRWLCKGCHRIWHHRHSPIIPRSDLDLRPFEEQLRAFAREKGIEFDELGSLLSSLEEVPIDDVPFLPDEDFPL